MGSMKDLMGMIPGVGKAMKNMDIPDDAFKHVEAMIKSMTPKEREQPSILNGTRRARIAKGSGRTVADVNKLIKQFEDMSKMMKMMQGKGGRQQMMNMMKNMPK
jgi:signal recognition particle subunit SRP54